MRRSRLSYGVTDEAVVAKATVCVWGGVTNWLDLPRRAIVVGSPSTEARNVLQEQQQSPVFSLPLVLTPVDHTVGNWVRDLCGSHLLRMENLSRYANNRQMEATILSTTTSVLSYWTVALVADCRAWVSRCTPS